MFILESWDYHGLNGTTAYGVYWMTIFVTLLVFIKLLGDYKPSTKINVKLAIALLFNLFNMLCMLSGPSTNMLSFHKLFTTKRLIGDEYRGKHPRGTYCVD